MANQETKLKVKWRVTGLSNIIITPDGVVYQLPYESKGKLFSIRRLEAKEHLGKNYYRIGKKRYSEEKLHAWTYESIETLEINDPAITTLPFSKKTK